MSDHVSCNICGKSWPSRNFSRHYNRCSKSLEVCQKCGRSVKSLVVHCRRTVCGQPSTTSTLESLFNSLLNVTLAQEYSSLSVQEVLQKLYECKTKANETFMNWVQGKKWYHICIISSDVKELWSGVLSRLFSVSQCWYHKADTHSDRLSIFIEAWCATFDDISNELSNRSGFYQVHDMYDQPSSMIAIVMTQLRSQPNETERLQQNSLVAVNLRLRSLEYNFKVSAQLNQELSFMNESFSFAANVTSIYAFVNLHIDRGMKSIFFCIDNCRKIWFM
jgi:hypothetical protein